MNDLILLSVEDRAVLQQFLNHDYPPPWPDPGQASLLGALLEQAQVTADPERLKERAGLGDRIALVSVADPRDFFALQIVLPRDADLDLDRIPVILPISLAVLGRRTGETAHWETSIGHREMRITAVGKRRCAALAE